MPVILYCSFTGKTRISKIDFQMLAVKKGDTCIIASTSCTINFSNIAKQLASKKEKNDHSVVPLEDCGYRKIRNNGH